MMPDILGMILWPFRWAIEALLVGFHWLLSQLGMNPSDGWTWVLAITGLVLVVRAALIAHDTVSPECSAKYGGDVGFVAGLSLRVCR
jgi:hypothetical protein